MSNKRTTWIHRSAGLSPLTYRFNQLGHSDRILRMFSPLE